MASSGPLLLLLPLTFILFIKRCHDFERSGWLSLVMLIPLAGLIFFLIPGTQGGNTYGFKPPNRWYHWTIVIGAIVLGLTAFVAYFVYLDTL